MVPTPMNPRAMRSLGGVAFLSADFAENVITKAKAAYRNSGHQIHINIY
jgi:hypothetical protein